MFLLELQAWLNRNSFAFFLPYVVAASMGKVGQVDQYFNCSSESCKKYTWVEYFFGEGNATEAAVVCGYRAAALDINFWQTYLSHARNLTGVEA